MTTMPSTLSKWGKNRTGHCRIQKENVALFPKLDITLKKNKTNLRASLKSKERVSCDF